MNLLVADLEMTQELDRNAMIALTGRGYSYGSWYNVGSPSVISGSYKSGTWFEYSHVKLFGASIYLEKHRYDTRKIQTSQRRKVVYKKWF